MPLRLEDLEEMIESMPKMYSRFDDYWYGYLRFPAKCSKCQLWLKQHETKRIWICPNCKEEYDTRGNRINKKKNVIPIGWEYQDGNQ